MSCRKYIDFNSLQLYHDKLMQLTDIKIKLANNKVTNCPNCAAPITSTKCEYCGTDFNIVFSKL